MKIISFNIGIKIDNAVEVVEYLKKQDADIICIQEAMRPVEVGVLLQYRSAEIIRESLKAIYPNYFFAPEWVADMFYLTPSSPDRIFGGMVEQGKLILSKYPIVRGFNYFYHKNYEFERDRRDFYLGNDHGRALQVCEIDLDGKIIQIANVHGCYSSDKMDNEKALFQSNFILEKLNEKKLPTILVGDFNVASHTESIKILEKTYQNTGLDFKITSTRPNKEQVIDYIFVDSNFFVNNMVIGNTKASDHFPLIAELEIK